MKRGWLGTVRVETRVLASEQEVRQLLTPLLERDGWVMYTDGWTWKAGTARGGSLHEPRGYPLAADLVDGDASVQLRHTGDAWLWTTITESDREEAEVPAPTGDGRYQGYDMSFVSSVEGPVQRRLGYRVWWRESQDPSTAPVRPLTPYVARFLGWEEA